MAYLGALGRATGMTPDWMFIAWSRSIIAYVVLGEQIGQYASHGGYIYIK